MSVVSNLLRKSKKKSGPLNILTFFYDGKFDIELLNTGHNFYGCIETSAYPWPGYRTAHYPNLFILQDIRESHNIEIDLVLFNNRSEHAKYFEICRSLHAPGLIIDHDYNLQNPYFLSKNKELTPFPHISCSEVVQKQYGADKYINYGVVPKNGEFNKDIDILCTVSTKHDIGLVNAIKQQFPSALIIGHHPQLPYAGTVETYEEYKNLFKRCSLFVNTSPQLDVNLDILFALSNNVPVVTIGWPVYGDLLKQRENCLLAISPEDLISQIKNLSFNKTIYNNIVKRGTNLSAYGQPSFVTKWAEVLTEHGNRAYIE